MDSLYSVVVRLGMDSTGFGAGATLATGMLQKLEQQALATGASTASLGKSLAMVGGGIALIAGGAFGVSLLKDWATAAGAFQNAMAGVGLSTQGTAAQLAALGQQTFITANKTQFSAVDIATIEKLAATNGLNQRDVLLRIVPTLGNLAEIDKQLRGISYEQSVPAAITVAHDFQSYPKNATEAKGFNSLLDLFGRSQLVAGTTPDAMAKLITYLAPARAAYNLTPEDIISTAALASNVGLAGGKGGGSRIMAMFRAIAPLLSSRGALHNAAQDKLQELGGGHYFKGGDFEKAGGVANMLTIVERAMGHIQDQGKRMSLLTAAFGAAGATAISIMATPGAVDRFRSIQGLLGPTGIASTDTMQGTLNATYQGQLATLAGNITSIKTLLGASLLPVITPVIHGFVELTGGIVTVLRTHPALAQFVTTFVAISTAAALIAGPVLIAAGAFGILSAAGVVTAGALLPVTLIALGIAGAVAGVTLAITHWGDIMAWARAHMILLHNAVLALAILFPPLGVAIGAGVLIFTHWHAITAALGGVLGALHPLISALGAVVGPVVASVGLLARAFGTWISTTDLLAGVLPALAGVLPALGGAVGALGQTLGGVVAGAIAGFNGAVTWLNTHVPLLAQALALLALPLTIAGGIFTHWGDITRVMGTVLGTVGGVLKGFGDLVGGVATIVRGLAGWIGHLIETVLRLASGPVRAALGGIGTAINAVGGVAGGIGGIIGGAAVGAAGAVAGTAGAAAGAVGGASPHVAVPGLPLLPTIPVAPHKASPVVHHHQTTLHLHVAAGSVVNHIAPGRDARKIAEEVTKNAGDHLGKSIADALARSGMLPATMRPTLHQLG